MTDRIRRIAVVGRSIYALHGVGGLERHLYDLVRYHLDAGWHVTLITRTPARPEGADPERWKIIRDHPRCAVRFVPYYTFPLAGRRGTTILDRSTAYPWFGLRAGRLAADLAAAGDIDAVYGVGAAVYGYAGRHRKPGGPRMPLVFNPQGMEEFGGADGGYGGRSLKAVGYAPLRSVVRATARGADAIIATDRSIAPIVRTHLGTNDHRVIVIPNGLDVVAGDTLVDAARGRELRERQGIPSGDALLVSVGRLEANKGFLDLAEALARVSSAQPWRWVLVGSGPDGDRLARHLAERGLSDRVTLTGRLADDALHRWYDAADLFVHPTRYEGSSLVTLEAMLHRKPVLATRTGGLPDKVVPGSTGWLVPPGDVASLSSALDEAFTARDRWRAYGAAGRALLESEFDWRVIQRQFAALYDRLIAGA